MCHQSSKSSETVLSGDRCKCRNVPRHVDNANPMVQRAVARTTGRLTGTGHGRWTTSMVELRMNEFCIDEGCQQGRIINATNMCLLVRTLYRDTTTTTTPTTYGDHPVLPHNTISRTNLRRKNTKLYRNA